MNRIDRISAILIQLQSRRVVKAVDIASRFNISLRTVYRDIKTLEEAGVPLMGEAGVGYALVDGYRLPPVMFTPEEAAAFVTAEKFMEKLTDASIGDHYRSAMYKIRAILKSADKDMLEDIDQNIEVVKGRSQRASLKSDILQTLINCIAKKELAAITYFAHHSQQVTQRTVEPIGVFYMEGYWHLIGFCHMRNDYRDFRVDRIRSLACTGKTFVNRHPTLKEYIAQMVRERNEVNAVVIRVEKDTAKRLIEQKYYWGFVSEQDKGDYVEMTFLTECIDYFSRWYFMFADKAEIVDCPELAEKLRNYVEALNCKVGTLA